MKRALITCGLLLLTVASAAPGTLTADKVHAEDATVSADVAVLRLRSDVVGGTATTFSLSAPHVRVEVDQSDTVVDAVQRVYVMDYTTTDDHSNASIWGRLRDNDDYEFVFGAWPGRAAPVVSWESECVVFGPSLRQEDRTEAEINGSRPSRVVSLDSALLPNQCGESWQLTIRGDFLVSAWGWSLTIDSYQGREVLETGVEQQDGPTARAAEAFLFVTNGTLQVSLEDWSAFYVKNANVTADTLALENARGTIHEDDGSHVLAGEDMTLYGVRDTSITGQGVGEALQIEVPPTGDLSPSTRMPEASPLRTPQAFAGFAAVATAVAAGLFVRRVPLIYEARARRRGESSIREPRSRPERRGAGWCLMARAALRAGHPAIALPFARRALRLFDEQPEVRLILAKALERLERYAEAEPHYIIASGMWKAAGNRDKRALAVLGIANCNAAAGDLHTALANFERLADLDPDLARARLGSPALLGLNGLPEFQTIRRRLDHSRTIFQPTGTDAEVT